MKQHEQKAIAGHPLTELLRNCATARRPPTRTEVIAEMQEAGLSEEQTERAITLARAVTEERQHGNTTWALRQAADEVSLTILKEWSAADSLDGKHQLYPAFHDEVVDFEAADRVAIANVDPLHGRFSEIITFEDGSQVEV